MTRLFYPLIIFCLTASSVRADYLQEDLSACKLPNALVTLTSRDMKREAIYRFSDGRFAALPKPPVGEWPSVMALVQQAHHDNLGDIMYSPLKDGTLLSIGGRMQDVGENFLYNLSGKTFDRPPEVFSVKERSAKGEPTPGAIEGVAEGHVFLIESVTGPAALVRVIKKSPQSALCQFVLQPDGTRKFTIPQGEKKKIAEDGPISAPATRPDNANKPAALPAMKPLDPDLAKAVAAHLDDRDQLIKRLIAVVDDENQQGQPALFDAMRSLGRLQASEAIPVLLKHIDAKDLLSPRRETGISDLFPAVGALMQIGKPASIAALAALDDIQRQGNDYNEAQRHHIMLLTVVIKGVEGREVAEFLLQREVQSPHRRHEPYQEAMKYLK